MFREFAKHVKYLASEAELGLRDTIVEAKAQSAADRILPQGWREMNIDDREKLAQELIDRRDKGGQLAFMYLNYVNFCEVLEKTKKENGWVMDTPRFADYRMHMAPYQKVLLKASPGPCKQ